jgi:SnoaL-like domain
LPPVAVAVGFVDAINRGDVEALGRMMSADHRLVVFDEEPVAGRDSNVEGWRGYLAAFPDYVIHPHRLGLREGWVGIVGHTTGSHLGLPDEQEAAMTMMWLAHVSDGVVDVWQLVEDTDDNRARFGIDAW